MNFTSVDNLHALSSNAPRLARAAALHIKRNEFNQSALEGENFLSQSQNQNQNHFQPLQSKKETFEQLQASNHLRWISHHRTNLQSNSLIDLNRSVERPSPHPVNISITEMTSDDFKEKYPTFADETSPEHTLRAMPSELLSSSDDDADPVDVPNDPNEEEIIYNAKIILEPKPLENKTSAAPSQPTTTTTTTTTNDVETKTKKKSKDAQTKHKKTHHVKRHKSSKPSSSASNTSNTNESSRVPSTPSKTTHSVPLVVKQDEINPIKPLITVDTSRARSNLEVVRLCLRELGWKECTSSTTLDADVYWHSASFHENIPNFSSCVGRVNKFPCMSDLLRKIHLTRSLNHMRLLFPHDYNFYPQTWFLPEQNQQFKDDVRYIHQQDKKHHRSPTTFIVKPSDGSQGEGIYLLRDPSHIITTNRPHVIQEYIDRPLLMNGLKFDLRIYVLILNLYPLEIFLYDEGLVRFATVDYKAPSTENLHQTYMHLTNYSLNKRSSNYKHAISDQQTDGSKRKLTLVWQQLAELYGMNKVERIQILIREMINKTILAITPELRVEYEFELPSSKKPNLSCFQIVGFDIILDEHLKPILLEVNSNPSLRIDFDTHESGKIVYQPSPIDEEIKQPLILETLKLALPKRKLDTIARHVQTQAQDEIMAQRLEKVAQRRVEERNEKIKSARTSRFDLKLNPFFSRPLESVAKEVERQQQEQKRENLRFRSQSPTILLRFAPSIFSSSSNDQNYRTPSIVTSTTKEPMKKVKKTHYAPKRDSTSHDEHNENAKKSPERKSTAHHHRSATIKRTSTGKSTATTNTSFSIVTATEISAICSTKRLKLIFPSNEKNQYQHLFLIDQIASIFIHVVVVLGQKAMTGGQFRNFANICGIINETITAPSIDILYYQILRKWQQFILRSTSSGLPFSAFVEAFFLLSQRKFPSAPSLLDSVDHLLHHCNRHLNSTLPSNNLNNSFQLQRNSARTTSVSLNIRPPSNLAPQRSILVPSTTNSNSRSRLLPQTTPAAAQTTTINNNNNNNNNVVVAAASIDNKLKQSTKSVFPLFFDVL